MESRTSLHCFADIVAYSGRNPYQQADCQQRLLKIIDESLIDAGLSPGSVQGESQGDARMLTFPDGLDVSRVLALMPRRFNDELVAYNRDVAPHARIRVRLAFAIGPSAQGQIGRAGTAPITVVRLSNAHALRAAMTAEPGAHLGVIIEDDLYRKHVAQAFRPDLKVDEYTKMHVSFPDKDFEEDAWIRLVGYPASTLQAPAIADAFAVAAVRPGGTSRPSKPPEVRVGDGTGSSHRRRRGLTPAWATLFAALIAAGVSLSVYFAGHSVDAAKSPGAPFTSASTGSSAIATASKGSGTASPSASVTTSVDNGSAPHSTIGSVGGAGTGTVTEYADWAYGVNVYTNNMAATSNVSVIPFNQQVEVSCVAPNYSGISSINAFYLIASGPWKGTYASANEFTNGGARESAADPDIDLRVRPCPAS